MLRWIERFFSSTALPITLGCETTAALVRAYFNACLAYRRLAELKPRSTSRARVFTCSVAFGCRRSSNQMLLARGRRLPRSNFSPIKCIASQLQEMSVVMSRRDRFVPEKLCAKDHARPSFEVAATQTLFARRQYMRTRVSRRQILMLIFPLMLLLS